MAFRLPSPTVVVSLLLGAALACLAVGFHLLSGGRLLAHGSPLVAALLGGVVVFLLGSAAVVTARRLAANRTPPPLAPELDLPLIDIREWSRELTDLRDDLRREGAAQDKLAEYRERELVVAGSFRPKGQYVLGPDGAPAAPLDGLKRTRDQLLEAAERVDAIVHSIEQATVPVARPPATPWWNPRRWQRNRD